MDAQNKNQDSSFVFFSHIQATPFLLEPIAKEAPLLVLSKNAQEGKELLAAWQFFYPQRKIAYFPDWELLPYERFSPHRDLVSERLSTLWKIASEGIEVLISPLTTAMQLLPPQEFILQRTLWLEKGQTMDVTTFRERLVENGYEHVNQVIAPREFSVRGSVLDLYPMGAAEPYRIDLFDNEIDNIRTFDPLSQHSRDEVPEIHLLPAHEFPTDPESIKLFRARFLEVLGGNAKKAHPFKSVSRAMFGRGVEFYFPLFFKEKASSLLDYLPENTRIVETPALGGLARQWEEEVKRRFKWVEQDPDYPPLPFDYLYLSQEKLHTALKKRRRYLLIKKEDPSLELPRVAIDRKRKDPLSELKTFKDQFQGRILLLADSLGRNETLANLAKEYGLKLTSFNSWQQFIQSNCPLGVVVQDAFFQGFIVSDPQVALITESDLYQNKNRENNRHSKKRGTEHTFMDLAEIKEGDLVVHEQHGVGRYLGLSDLESGQAEEVFMLIEYKGSAKLYVPVSELHLISRYQGQKAESVLLDSLGKDHWRKQKDKAWQKAWDTAADLLDIYAKRSLQRRPPYCVNPSEYKSFVQGFAYEETEDQEKAIDAVLQDLSTPEPMDRLICGDVGFGKTEVALRAAFVVAMNGRQVAILAPTTLLVEQHYETFLTRFASTPIRVEALSRFVSGNKTQKILADVTAGQVDILIGTHKLLQENVVFKNLGLLVIDEEHRFGVRQKEKIKSMRAKIDVLAMTATPIPRTLAMALDQLRDFSLIATAPEKRLAVKTFVQPYSEAVIQEAIRREVRRNGQVFFLHNDVATIEVTKNRLQTLFPDYKFALAHGQMKEKELEQVMRSFLRQQYDVLVCSTIIETGIDIPNANTIIIDRADKFGLAQLHQLRGRVGRSHHQAYAYLLTADTLKKGAKQRLEAIEYASDLGSGFFLAMQDLEIRGSGEILGDNQSGEMLKVGLTLYSEMLKKAVKALEKGEKLDSSSPLEVNSEIKLYAPALLSASYIPGVDNRLVFYKKLAKAKSEKDLNEVAEQMIDRFGLQPQEVKLLFTSHRLRLQAEALGIARIIATSDKILFKFSKNNKIDVEQLVRMIQEEPQIYRLKEGHDLMVHQGFSEVEKRVKAIEQILNKLNSIE